jgi:hypothetical protein
MFICQSSFVIAARQKIYRVVVKYIIVVKAIGKHFDIECAAHGKQVGYLSRVLKREVCCVVTAKAAAGNRYLPTPVSCMAQGAILRYQHFIVPGVIAGAVGGVDAFIIPTAVVNGIGAVDLHQALIHKPARASIRPKSLFWWIAPLWW